MGKITYGDCWTYPKAEIDQLLENKGKVAQVGTAESTNKPTVIMLADNLALVCGTYKFASVTQAVVSQAITLPVTFDHSKPELTFCGMDHVSTAAETTSYHCHLTHDNKVTLYANSLSETAQANQTYNYMVIGVLK